MPSLSPSPGFDYYFKACRKGDPEAKAVAIGESPVRVLADGSEISLPRHFETHEILKEEFERRNSLTVFAVTLKYAILLSVLPSRGTLPMELPGSADGQRIQGRRSLEPGNAVEQSLVELRPGKEP
jgi:hypothetical protein